MSAPSDIASPSGNLAWWDQDVLVRANIIPNTGLATDYLNVFNEAFMLISMLADMPEMMDELRDWKPLTYEEHFKRSSFQAKDLAILAYQNAERVIIEEFDGLTAQASSLYLKVIQEAHGCIVNNAVLGDYLNQKMPELEDAIRALDAVIHGHKPTVIDADWPQV